MLARVIKRRLRVDSHAPFAWGSLGQPVTTIRKHEDVTAHELPKDVGDGDAVTHVA